MQTLLPKSRMLGMVKFDLMFTLDCVVLVAPFPRVDSAELGLIVTNFPLFELLSPESPHQDPI